MDTSKSWHVLHTAHTWLTSGTFDERRSVLMYQYSMPPTKQNPDICCQRVCTTQPSPRVKNLGGHCQAQPHVLACIVCYATYTATATNATTTPTVNVYYYTEEIHHSLKVNTSTDGTPMGT